MVTVTVGSVGALAAGMVAGVKASATGVPPAKRPTTIKLNARRAAKDRPMKVKRKPRACFARWFLAGSTR